MKVLTDGRKGIITIPPGADATTVIKAVQSWRDALEQETQTAFNIYGHPAASLARVTAGLKSHGDHQLRTKSVPTHIGSLCCTIGCNTTPNPEPMVLTCTITPSCTLCVIAHKSKQQNQADELKDAIEKATDPFAKTAYRWDGAGKFIEDGPSMDSLATTPMIFPEDLQHMTWSPEQQTLLDVVAARDYPRPIRVLLSGPPGGGKTRLALSLCKTLVDAGKTVIAVPSLVHAHALASLLPGAVLLVEDVEQDQRLQARTSEMNVLLEKLDGGSGNIHVIATTNHLELLPEPLLRPGRFDWLLHVDYPSPASIARQLTSQGILATERHIDSLSGLSWAFIAEFVRRCRLLGGPENAIASLSAQIKLAKPSTTKTPEQQIAAAVALLNTVVS